MSTLVLAAGGGGDAVGALLVRRLLPVAGDAMSIATLAWERLRIDPVPGPRGADGFDRLGPVGGRRIEILPTTRTVPAGRSSLPRLASEAQMRLFLLDPRAGARGLGEQLEHLAENLAVERLVVVDVGGDAVARGDEAGLRSPLADALVLAAASTAGVPATVVVVGPGVDGELGQAEVLDRLEAAGGSPIGAVTARDAAWIADVLSWHPTEMSALVAAAAQGLRGLVAIGRKGLVVPLTDRTPEAWAAPLSRVLGINRVAAAVAGTTGLEQAHEIVSAAFVSELTYERDKAARVRTMNSCVPTAEALVRLAGELHDAGVRYVTTRGLSERLNVPRRAEPQLDELLLDRADSRREAVWDVAALAGVTT